MPVNFVTNRNSEQYTAFTIHKTTIMGVQVRVNKNEGGWQYAHDYGHNAMETLKSPIIHSQYINKEKHENNIFSCWPGPRR